VILVIGSSFGFIGQAKPALFQSKSYRVALVATTICLMGKGILLFLKPAVDPIFLTVGSNTAVENFSLLRFHYYRSHLSRSMVSVPFRFLFYFFNLPPSLAGG
tara:strand:- start:714 stop:1022 length:309 start_codon:yes stop_codon:yes gene_type:complete